MAPSLHDWRDLAACRSAGQEMVPAEHDGAAVLLAKKLCLDCPVRDSCLFEAERLGAELVQGAG